MESKKELAGQHCQFLTDVKYCPDWQSADDDYQANAREKSELTPSPHSSAVNTARRSFIMELNAHFNIQGFKIQDFELYCCSMDTIFTKSFTPDPAMLYYTRSEKKRRRPQYCVSVAAHHTPRSQRSFAGLLDRSKHNVDSRGVVDISTSLPSTVIHITQVVSVQHFPVHELDDKGRFRSLRRRASNWFHRTDADDHRAAEFTECLR
jgi:hypothetical protein